MKHPTPSQFVINVTEAHVNDEPAKTEVEGEIVRREVIADLRHQPEDESERVANNINSVLQRVSTTSVQEIERLITELETLRDTLRSEAPRVEREVVEYASLTESAVQSTKIIAESLTHWRTAPGAPTLSNSSA